METLREIIKYAEDNLGPEYSSMTIMEILALKQQLEEERPARIFPVHPEGELF